MKINSLQKALKKTIIYCSLFILIIFQNSTVFAQTDKIEPEAGIGKNYFVEGDITAESYKKIDELKKEIKDLNDMLKGYWIEKKTDPDDYKECVDWHKALEKEALDFNTVAIKPAPKKSNKSSSTPKLSPSSASTSANTSSASYDTSVYFTNEKCFYTGYIDDYRFYENMYKKVGCDLNKITQGLTSSKIDAIVQKQNLDTSDKDTKYIIDELKKEINSKKTTSASSSSSSGSSNLTKEEQKRQEKCEYYYFDWYFAIKNAENTLKEIKEKNDELKKLENPELFACQYKTSADGTSTEINNKLCVKFTERLGSTRVIGAKSGIGLLKVYLALLYRYAAIIVGIAAVLMIIISGIQIAVGGEEAMTKAKDRLVNAMIGIAVLFLSGAILYIINPNFFTY